MIDAEHHVAVHFDEAPVAVVSEALVARAAREAFDRDVVEAEVEDRVHHAGHGDGGARAHREQQRVRGIAEGGAGRAARGGDGFANVGFEALGQSFAVGEEVAAYARGDREAGGDGEAQAGHFGKIGTLPAEFIGETRVTIRMFGAEPIDPSWHRAAVSADVTLTRTRAPCCVHDNRDARASRHRLRMLA